MLPTVMPVDPSLVSDAVTYNGDAHHGERSRTVVAWIRDSKSKEGLMKCLGAP